MRKISFISSRLLLIYYVKSKSCSVLPSPGCQKYVNTGVCWLNIWMDVMVRCPSNFGELHV